MVRRESFEVAFRPSHDRVVIRPGPRNSLTDVAGLLVGNAEDAVAHTGATVVLPERRALAAADVRGGAPGTINTDALEPGGLIREVDGIVLSGGSVFGLEAATGLTGWLAARGRGFTDWGPCLPVVAGAVLFDLLNGGDKGWGERPPYRELARAAADRAGPEVALGNAGAGMGALAGNLKGGLGTASAVDAASGLTVAALVAVNSVGSVTMPGSAAMWAWHLEQAGELGGQPAPTGATGHAFETKRGIGMNTTIGVVATDAALDQADLRRLAVMAQGGYVYAIRPIHTPFDGDAVFALATGARPPPDRPDALVRLGAVAADVVARAVMRGVHAADDLGEFPAYRTAWPKRP
jgi:L-aminopeptidase/D-esterase-like protein